MDMTNPKVRDREIQVTQHLQGLEQCLQEFSGLFTPNYPEEDLLKFDVETEAFLADVFGNPSEILEAYALAQTGEAAGWVNLPEEAQEEGAQDVAKESLQQRKRVLERGVAELKNELKKLHK